MKSYSHQFTPDYGASPAENVKKYIAGLKEPLPLGFKFVEFSNALRDAFTGEDGRLDTANIYTHRITGKDIYHEQVELMRNAIMLDPTKDEMKELIEMMISKHGPGSSNNPRIEDRNKQQWTRQSENTFGIASKERKSRYMHEF